MRKIIKLSLLILLTISIFSSCSKFEEGPSLSLKSKKARLANTWEIETIYDSNNNEIKLEDLLDDFAEADTSGLYDFEISGMGFTFEKDGTMETIINMVVWGISFPVKTPGTWEFVGDTNLEVTTEANEEYGTTGGTEEYNILRLSSSELWLEYTDAGEKVEFHLIPEE